MKTQPTLLETVKPSGPVTHGSPIPVLVVLRYRPAEMGVVRNHPAEAIAWTKDEVLVRWGTVAQAWLPARDVRRAD